MFERADFKRLSRLLKRLKGRFLLSLNDCPEVRENFKDFKIEAVNTSYSVSSYRGQSQPVGEVLISR